MSWVTAAVELPDRFPHQTRLITTLTQEHIQDLCNLLYLPPSMAPNPTPEWLASQADVIMSLPSKLRRPDYRRTNGTSRYDSQARLCSGHAGLNGYIISALMGLLASECNWYNRPIRDCEELSVLQEILCNTEDHDTIMHKISNTAHSLTGELYVGNGCAACILAAIGSHRPAVEVLAAAMRVCFDVGGREEMSVLNEFLHQWARIQEGEMGRMRGREGLYDGIVDAWEARTWDERESRYWNEQAFTERGTSSSTMPTSDADIFERMFSDEESERKEQSASPEVIERATESAALSNAYPYPPYSPMIPSRRRYEQLGDDRNTRSQARYRQS